MAVKLYVKANLWCTKNVLGYAQASWYEKEMIRWCLSLVGKNEDAEDFS